jgi:hypothetical protein
MDIRRPGRLPDSKLARGCRAFAHRSASLKIPAMLLAERDRGIRR